MDAKVILPGNLFLRNILTFFIPPHLEDTVDHTIGTCKITHTFTQALWNGYNTGTKEVIKTSINDYCLDVYQHHNEECFQDTV